MYVHYSIFSENTVNNALIFYTLDLLDAMESNDDNKLDAILNATNVVRIDFGENAHRNIFKMLVVCARKSSKELGQLREQYRDTKEKLQVSEEYGDKFRHGQRGTTNAQMKKMFIKHVREHNIIIERITDLDIQSMKKHISGLEGVTQTTRKKWYKEAMPHVTLKHGAVKKEQAE